MKLAPVKIFDSIQAQNPLQRMHTDRTTAALVDRPEAPAFGYGRMPTLSGCVTSWESGPIPPLTDFLVQLHRMPRFVGATSEPFSVLQHCLHCYWIAHETAPDVAVPALLHDFGEILTGDVPTPMKPAAWREPEKRFVERIAAAWGWAPEPPLDWPAVWEAVKQIDHLALHLEGAALTCWGVWRPEPGLAGKIGLPSWEMTPLSVRGHLSRNGLKAEG